MLILFKSIHVILLILSEDSPELILELLRPGLHCNILPTEVTFVTTSLSVTAYRFDANQWNFWIKAALQITQALSWYAAANKMPVWHAHYYFLLTESFTVRICCTSKSRKVCVLSCNMANILALTPAARQLLSCFYRANCSFLSQLKGNSRWKENFSTREVGRMLSEWRS